MYYCFYEDQTLQEMLGMLVFNVYFRAWPTSRLFSLKLVKQVVLHFTDHSHGSFETKFKSLLVKNKVSLVGPLERTTRRMTVVCKYYYTAKTFCTFKYTHNITREVFTIK